MFVNKHFANFTGISDITREFLGLRMQILRELFLARYMNTTQKGEFQICISVTLKKVYGADGRASWISVRLKNKF